MSSTFDVKTFLDNLTKAPGIYQMLDAQGTILYVGKAKNLKNRVSSYFQKTTHPRIASLVKQINQIEIIVTSSENEALLLENNLIKKYKPRYNILFRDDKSYPYIYLSDHQDFPRLDFHRGAKTGGGDYYGPYPSAGAVRQSLNLLQKLFLIRQCRDNFFKNRTRPCIQYQIKRCTAPCVGLVAKEDYLNNVRLAKLFLSGKSQEVIFELMQKMELASQARDYEKAALYRDQVHSLRTIQEQQHVVAGHGDIDVIAIVHEDEVFCLQILFIRAGRMIGNHHFFIKSPLETTQEEVLQGFIPQFYLSPKHQHDIPAHILLNCKLQDTSALAEVLSDQRGAKVNISKPMRGERLTWVMMAEKNATTILLSHLAGKATFMQRLEALKIALKLDNLPQKIECFDISHSMGEATVASCVVFNQEGSDKASYRRFNIKGITKGDDYAALYQALNRRYGKIKAEGQELPDVILIDGGKGQLHQAIKVLENLQITGVNLFSIAKGPGRKPGLETIFKAGMDLPIKLDPHDSGFHVLQQIRDEAHRFAITGHKKQREKARRTSPLEGIPGIGAKRRKQLLNYFGGLKDLQAASPQQIAKVPGISAALAQQIYDFLHE